MTDLHYAIDRFEGEQAVLQDDSGRSFVVNKAVLPPNALQGDVLKHYDGYYQYDRTETTNRRNRIHHLEQLLRGRNQGEDDKI